MKKIHLKLSFIALLLTATMTTHAQNVHYARQSAYGSGNGDSWGNAPASVSVVWGNTSLTYNGNPQTPTATATDANGINLPLSVTGAHTNVGSGYMATASLEVPDNNYMLSGETTTFRINPATISIKWDNTSFTYNGMPQVPAATATGVNGEDLPLKVTGAQINAGAGYTATAMFAVPNNNYIISDATIEFVILPAAVTIQWGVTSFIYNGYPQAPTATATDIYDEDLPLIVIGEQTNVGTGYTATAILSVPDNNYLIINPTTTFDIIPATLEITAISETISYGRFPLLAYTITSGELMRRDALSGALAVESQLKILLQWPYPVGVHAIVQGTLDAGSNYNIIFHEGTLTVLSISTALLDLFVNNEPVTFYESMYHAIAENGESQALIQVVTDPYSTAAINGIMQNPLIVDLPKYGENYFIITVTAQNGNSQDYLLVILRCYEQVIYEFYDVPAINCNMQTNGGYNFTGFQWYRDGEAIAGAHFPYYQIKDKATYYCVLTLDDDVHWRSVNIHSLASRSSGKLTAYPNPTHGNVTIQQETNKGINSVEIPAQGKSSDKSIIQVFDLNGDMVMQPTTNPFDMSALPNGIYLIKVNGETVKVIKR